MIHRVRFSPELLLLVLLALSGCASTHNFKTDGFSPFGGGFTEEEVRPGLYRMSATSNMAPWPSFGAASSTWKMRAEQLCGKDEYMEFEISQSDGRGQNVPVFVPSAGAIVAPRYNATVSGYLLCNSARMTIADATTYLLSQRAAAEQKAAEDQRQELERLGGANCSQSESEFSGEIYFRRWKALLALKEYPAARACFFRAQEVEKNTTYYKESCYFLGLMYEIGMGVERDMQLAKVWYGKAGI